MTEGIHLTPIGYVSSPVTEPLDSDWGKIISRVILRPEYAGSLKGIESFSHAIIVTYLHQSRFDLTRHLLRRPQDREEMPEVGMFSQRAKHRPNPIGITTVPILEAADSYLDVKGLDAVDHTPVLDIKPYFPQFDRVLSPTVPAWVDELMKNYF